MTTYNRFSPNYPITASGSIDMLGDEFPSLLMSKAREPITDADIVAYLTQGPQQPRPTITAWEGADMDAYWKDGLEWRHCQTGAVWVASFAEISAATDAMLAKISALHADTASLSRSVEASTRMDGGNLVDEVA